MPTRPLVFWFCVFALVVIHTLDMELTHHYVGDNWQYETFPLMSWTLYYVGINYALWISRICTYAYLYFSILWRHRADVSWLLFVICVLYYCAMVQWLFTLGYLAWP